MTEPGQRLLEGAALVGRDRDKRRLAAFVQSAGVDGGSLLLIGEAGVGKTALLEFTSSVARSAGALVLEAAGVEFESDVSFAGLNQLLMPLSDRLTQLPDYHRGALSVALGLGGGPAADRMVVASATLALLQDFAADRPLLLVVDDLPWIDRASALVLGFVARRLRGTAIGMLAAQRQGDEGFFERTGIPLLQVRPLTDETASKLVNDRFPGLAPQVSARLVTDAGGIPLALLELPQELTPAQRSARETLPMMLPLSRHLQTVFGSRVSALPVSTRKLLLQAALDSSGDLRVAGDQDDGRGDDMGPAEQARLITVDYRTRKLVFVHPLIRSGVVDLATSGERRAAHRSLAELFADDPDRRARHLAEATIVPDEEVARQLEHSAHRVLRRGDGVAAVATLIRAAELSPEGVQRARRLSEAAYVGADFTGAIDNVSVLLGQARSADPAGEVSLSAAVAAAYVMLSEGEVDTAHRLLVGAIATSPPGGDPALQEALYTLLLVCFFGGRSALWKPFDAALEKVQGSMPAVLTISAVTLADPARSTPPVLGELDTAIAMLGRQTDPNEIYRLAIAAIWVDRLDECRAALMQVAADEPAGAALVPAVRALLIVSVGDFMAGRWDDSARLADQGMKLLQQQPFDMLEWSGWHAQGLVAAGRGEHTKVQTLLARMQRWSAPRGMGSVEDYMAHVAGLAALGRGDYEEAYRNFEIISPAGHFAPHKPFALWVVMDLVESAVRTGRHEAAAAHVAGAAAQGVAAISSRLALHCAAAAALVATESDAPALFERALATPPAGRWPFDRARIELAYGERLRRAKATSDARLHLSTALQVFRDLGAKPWVDRAEAELLATGQTRHTGAAESELTPQESEIATLAATGLSNRQIGERLYLSPRTIGAHLYRIFPKLHVSSRAGLRDALTNLSTSGVST